MIQIPNTLPATSRNQNSFAAEYIQNEVNMQAQQGWEFYRIDEVTLAVPPGCLAALLGQRETYTRYSVISFRKAR